MAATPEQIQPADGAVIRTASAVFSWQPSDSDPDFYTLQLSQNADFSTIDFSADTEETKIEQVFEFGILYYWRVRTSDGTPIYSAEAFSFQSAELVPAAISTHGDDGLNRMTSQFRDS
jgi:hypothetical protein